MNMPRHRILLATITVLLHSGVTHGGSQPESAPAYKQTYESCGLVGTSIFSAINDYTLGVPLQTALKSCWPGKAQCNVQRAYDMAKAQGVASALMSAHVFVMQCANEVTSRLGSKEMKPEDNAYRQCLNANGVRTNILAAIDKHKSLDETKALM